MVDLLCQFRPVIGFSGGEVWRTAVRAGDVEILSILLDHYVVDVYLDNVLEFAIGCGNQKIVDLLEKAARNWQTKMEAIKEKMEENNWEYKDINEKRYFIRYYNNREQKVLLKTIMKRMDKYTLDKIGFYFGDTFKNGRELVGDS